MALSEQAALPKRLKIAVRLLRNGDIAVGPGKAALLDAIIATGSISAAARSLGLSYRRAWMMVDMMNQSFAEPLVDTVAGARHGAAVNEFGVAVLADYRAIDAAAKLIEADAAGQRLLARLRN